MRRVRFRSGGEKRTSSLNLQLGPGNTRKSAATNSRASAATMHVQQPSLLLARLAMTPDSKLLCCYSLFALVGFVHCDLSFSASLSCSFR